MAIRNKHGIYWVTALFLAVVLVLGVLHGCKREPKEPNEPVPPNNVAAVPAGQTQAIDPIQAAANLFREPKAGLQNVIKAAQTWYPILAEWQDKPAPDFTLTDVEGKPHRLGDYRGKDVVVVFWRTWDRAHVKLEVPYLKELRDAYGKDKLAILAISSEPLATMKAFADEHGLNYTVLVDTGGLPAPFSQVETTPTSFFLNPEGNVKLAVRGIVPTSDAKEILKAQ